MITIEEARKIIREQHFDLTIETRKVDELETGDVLAEDILAPNDLPLFSNSMMDGYVIADHSETYEIVGEIAAGETGTFSIKPGTAFRIFTGAPIPDNSLAVIMQEKATVVNNKVIFSDSITAGKNIRVQGDEVKKGELILPAGTSITAGVVGLLATQGISKVLVYQKPVINVLSTGDECKPTGTVLKTGEIYESNGIMIKNALSSYGFQINQRAHAIDQYEATYKQIKKMIEQSDVLIITGGISVGDHDYVGKCLLDMGVKELFYKVKQKPGKPIFMGRLGNKLIMALPGNPASTLTCLYQYGIPACRKFTGLPDDQIFPYPIQMILKKDHSKKGDRPEFVRSMFQPDGEVEILTKQRSSMLHSYAMANCLVFLPEGVAELKKGVLVTGYLF